MHLALRYVPSTPGSVTHRPRTCAHFNPPRLPRPTLAPARSRLTGRKRPDVRKYLCTDVPEVGTPYLLYGPSAVHSSIVHPRQSTTHNPTIHLPSIIHRCHPPTHLGTLSSQSRMVRPKSLSSLFAFLILSHSASKSLSTLPVIARLGS